MLIFGYKAFFQETEIYVPRVGETEVVVLNNQEGQKWPTTAGPFAVPDIQVDVLEHHPQPDVFKHENWVVFISQV